ncbi:hypothetical protein [Spirillospora sp. NPDC029432]|uniref:hypothetical protein n=1 Tax=Spirillospora sp. NPDC029432 TaxID=3154599 RepID=UPI00345541EE
MNMTGRTTPSRAAALLLVATLLTGCGGDDGQKKTAPKTPAANSTSPPPTFTFENLRAALLPAKEVGADQREIPVALESLKERGIPMCSLSSIQLTGDPETMNRQFTNPAKGKDEVKYAQSIARFKSPAEASKAYAKVQQKARSCPAKQSVPQKRIRTNYVLLAHDDTWKVSEGSLVGWTHLRGTEKHVEPPSQTKYNVYHFMYDYALRGNIIVSSLYWERTEPKKSGEPVAKRATEVLTKQLRKIG